MGKFKDLTGQRFDRLTVIEKTVRRGAGAVIWLCKCDCGNHVEVRGNNLTSGKTKSCGCLFRETQSVRHKRPADIGGLKFGRLTAIEPTDRRSRNSVIWRCRCDCGNFAFVASNHLKSGNTQSCGCQKRENQPKSVTKHGQSNSRLYGVWHGMLTRCYNANAINYKDYGGRGIKVCDEWRNDFEAFHKWSLSHGYIETAPRGQCTLDRIEVNGDYTPDNCRWVDMKTQASNTRKSN